MPKARMGKKRNPITPIRKVVAVMTITSRPRCADSFASSIPAHDGSSMVVQETRFSKKRAKLEPLSKHDKTRQLISGRKTAEDLKDSLAVQGAGLYLKKQIPKA